MSHSNSIRYLGFVLMRFRHLEAYETSFLCNINKIKLLPKHHAYNCLKNRALEYGDPITEFSLGLLNISFTAPSDQ